MYKQTIILLAKIRERPGMYLGECSIIRLRQYIGGYQHALGESGTGETATSENLSDFHYFFQQWVIKRFALPQTTEGWDDLLLKVAGSDEAAFDLFWELWDKYTAPLRNEEAAK